MRPVCFRVFASSVWLEYYEKMIEDCDTIGILLGVKERFLVLRAEQ